MTGYCRTTTKQRKDGDPDTHDEQRTSHVMAIYKISKHVDSNIPFTESNHASFKLPWIPESLQGTCSGIAQFQL